MTWWALPRFAPDDFEPRKCTPPTHHPRRIPADDVAEVVDPDVTPYSCASVHSNNTHKGRFRIDKACTWRYV